jgi:hypothetical protein
MSNLSKALQKYYSRDRKRVFFRNGQSLNQLALAMWERLGFQQIDASVLSRVLKGERLFTTPQLKVFCGLLELPKNEEDYLFACLQQDHNARLDLYAGTTYISSSLAEELVKDLTKNAFELFYQGNYGALEKKYELIHQLAASYLLGNSGDQAIGEALGLNLYLRGRTIANGELPSRVIDKIYPIFSQLIKMSRTSHSRLLHGYAYVLLCTAYYLAGGYSNSSAKYRFYSTSIKLAKKAVDNLPEDDHEALFALRSMAASAYYIHDQATVLYVAKKVKEVIPKQPKENYINALHLSITLSKGLAATNTSNPFLIQEFATNHFKRSLSHTGVYEVSAIKEEIDTLLLLGTQDNSYIQRRLKEGLELASEYNFSRQKKYFNKLLRTL